MFVRPIDPISWGHKLPFVSRSGSAGCGRSDPGHLTQQLARDVAVRPNLVLYVLRKPSEGLTARLTELASELRQEYGENPRIDLFRQETRDQARRTFWL